MQKFLYLLSDDHKENENPKSMRGMMESENEEDIEYLI
jgi:hypothetical protein